MGLDDSITYLSGVGPKRAELFNKLGVRTVKDLLYHLPRSYMDFTSPVSINEAALDEYSVIRCKAVKKRSPDLIRKNMKIFRILFTDDEADVTAVIFNSVYLYNQIKEGKWYYLYGRLTGNLTTKEISSPIIFEADSEDKIQPIYPLTQGLSVGIIRRCMKNALMQLENESCETLSRDFIEKNGFMGADAALHAIHFPKSMDDAASARRRLAFDELLVLQLGMLSLKEKNRRLTPYPLKEIPLDKYYEALPFELTGAQRRSIGECISDMTENTPMNRLILGDVGSGKTAVAAALCYFTFLNGCQSCIMAPTEILADQHYATFCRFLEPLGVKIALLKGSMSQRKKADVKEALKNGDFDIAIGTHALLQQSTEFKNLALVITDEQHRFGVQQRKMLVNKGNNPHRLVMSATPIPRTLALMIYGELDISLLDEMPKGRKKILTYAVTGKLRSRAYNFVKDRLDEGRQAYIICPAIEDSQADIKNVTDYAKSLSESGFGSYNIGVLHGQMRSDAKEKIMRDFQNGRTDILVATTVVEVGVDVPNAAVMLIENADRFGLSQLHQLRGRVGRGEYQSYCILIADNAGETSRKRLKALSNSSDGFEISEMDLEIRGPGDFFGSAQHGLPRLKIADLAADADLIRLARVEAEKMYSTGYLKSSDGARLSGAVKRLFESDEPLA